jgi:hypothetical protein
MMYGGMDVLYTLALDRYVKVKLSLLQAVEARRVVRRRGFHIF